jgi:hypothetical protein
MEKFEEMKALLEQTQGDAEKFFNKGTSTAGTRVRLAMQALKKLADELRKEIQENKKSKV